MSLRAFFLQRKDTRQGIIDPNPIEEKVVCDTVELKSKITNWLLLDGWQFENFSDFLELAGIKTPVRLNKYNKNNASFCCVMVNNLEVLISIRLGMWGFETEFYVTEEEETRGYAINNNYEREEDVPQVILRSRVIKKDGKELTNDYFEYFCNRKLKIDDTHILKIEIDEPDKYDDRSEILVLRNCSEIEDYLIGLDNSFVISQVYDTVIKLLSFSDEDIAASSKILFSYEEIVDGGEDRVISKILIENGKRQEKPRFW